MSEQCDAEIARRWLQHRPCSALLTTFISLTQACSSRRFVAAVVDALQDDTSSAKQLCSPFGALTRLQARGHV